jgi:hypothetical protein
MLARGIYPPPSQFEAWFISGAHTDKDIAVTVKAAREAMRDAPGPAGLRRRGFPCPSAATAPPAGIDSTARGAPRRVGWGLGRATGRGGSKCAPGQRVASAARFGQVLRYGVLLK